MARAAGTEAAIGRRDWLADSEERVVIEHWWTAPSLLMIAAEWGHETQAASEAGAVEEDEAVDSAQPE